MASYLLKNGNSEEGALRVIQESIDDLEQQFLPWQRRVETWDRAVFPDSQGHVARDLGSYFMEGLKPDQLRRSNYVTQWCRSSIEALINRLMRAEKTVLPKTLSESEEVVGQMERFIMFCLGIFYHLDAYDIKSWSGTGFDYKLKASLAFFGKAITAVQVVSNGNGAQVQAKVLDPYRCFHDLGGHVRRFVYKQQLPVRDLPDFLRSVDGSWDMERISPDTKTVPVYSFWLEEPGQNKHTDVWEAILIGEEKGRKSAIFPGIVKKRRFSQIPISIVYRSTPGGIDMGGPQDQKGLSDSTIARHAEPFYAPAIPILEQLNALLSLDMDNTALSVLPPLLVKPSLEGERPVEKTDIGPAELVYLRPQDILEALKIGGAQLAQSQSFARLLDELESFFPTALRHPESNPGDSGYKVNSELDMAENVMVPWTRLVNQIDTDVLRQIIMQHQATNYVFELPGKRSLVNGIMEDYFLRWSNEDYPEGSLAVEVEEPTELPKDWYKSFLIYQLSVSSGALDPITARYRVLKMSNSYAVQKRIDAEQLRQTPFMLADRMLADLAERASALDDEADRARREKQRPETVTAKEIAAKAAWIRLQRAQQSALGGGSPSAAQPALPPPEVMPPEESMPVSPDEQATIEGRPNAPRRGRPRPEGTR